MTLVMVFGTFDILHPGHSYFLKQAKKKGDYLVAVLARDLTVKDVKNRFPKNNEQLRLKNLEKLKIADKVLMGSLSDKFELIEQEKPDIICLGYDQNSFTANLREELRKRNILADIFRLDPFKEDVYKSSKLR
ncbi:MAG: FAD synthase [bacterium]|nr:FAD synthase [bacterium]